MSRAHATQVSRWPAGTIWAAWPFAAPSTGTTRATSIPTLDQVRGLRTARLATFGAEASLAGWTLGVEAQAAGARFDDAANTGRLGGYGLVNLVAGRMLMPGLSLEGRVDNLGDKAYELARTYTTPGRNAQLTLRWTL